MISLNRTLKAIMNKIKNPKLVQEKITFGNTWVAPHNGIIIRGGRAQSNIAYMFCKDTAADVFIGLCTIENDQHYGTMTCPVIKGKTYEFKQQYWQIQNDLYLYIE